MRGPLQEIPKLAGWMGFRLCGVACRAAGSWEFGLRGVLAGAGLLPSYAIMGLLRHCFHKHADNAYIGRHIHRKHPEDKVSAH